jgi:hypothetical protein
VALCRYRGTPPAITPETLDAACANYFVEAVDTSSYTPVLTGGAPAGAR